jgi:hypothetical protein
MPTLKGLPNTKRDKACEIVRSVSAVLSVLRRHKGAVGAGDYGSVTIWIDDAGDYRCEATRYYAGVNSEQPKTLKGVAAWAKKWLPWCQTGELHHD